MATLALAALPPAAREALAAAAAVLGPRGEAWLVGGAVRDVLAGEPVRELDLAVPSGAVELGRALADRLGAGFVGPRWRARRLPGRRPPVQIDIADFRAPSLADDLRGARLLRQRARRAAARAARGRARR